MGSAGEHFSEPHRPFQMTDQPTSEAQPPPLISLRGISKSFGDVKANDLIDLDVFASKVLALLGENGAGKSTLVKILYGFYQADSGTIEHRGKPVNIQSPQDARALQIGMVFQSFSLIPAFTVAENMALFFRDLGRVMDLKKISGRIESISERYNLMANPAALVTDLSVGDLQKAEILKLLLSDSRVLILDEPTRVLAPHEIQALFEVLDNLRADGFAIILITHKMKEVMDIADHIVVLRNGRVAGSLSVAEASEQKLIEMMFARPVTEFRKVERPESEAGEALLELKNVSTKAEGARMSLKAIDLEIRSGEIVGITGVSGNGQRELADLVLGRLPAEAGSIVLRGKDATGFSIRRIRREGVAFIPESPMAMAVAPYMTVLENMAVPQIERYARNGGFTIDWDTVRQEYTASMEQLDITLSFYALARSLSGGNLQRLVIVRELAHQPSLIIASYLTSGLDVRSAIAAREALTQARARGAGVLFFSDDLDELFALSDRLIVLHEGKIRGHFAPVETSYEQIGYLMTGSETSGGD
jgi:simple sugar transport system ATP-binding protein